MNAIISGIFSAFLFSGQLSAPFSWEGSTQAKEADREGIADQKQIEEINEREAQSFYESSLEGPELYIDGQRQIYTPFLRKESYSCHYRQRSRLFLNMKSMEAGRKNLLSRLIILKNVQWLKKWKVKKQSTLKHCRIWV
ncbi:hypothetical protein [Thalassobacillus sp. C254]|uniref:hypothetical protein n=1 Tax=Thalassobacillus sp. C254 TaxID=1225341 RepID=UPI0006D156BE|nr:hypothetical protein [Thalassobacillus sp. C254]